MFSVWYAKHPSVAFVFKGLDSPFQISRQRPALASIEKHRQDKWPREYNLCGKTKRDGLQQVRFVQIVSFKILSYLAWVETLARETARFIHSPTVRTRHFLNTVQDRTPGSRYLDTLTCVTASRVFDVVITEHVTVIRWTLASRRGWKTKRKIQQLQILICFEYSRNY